MSDEVRTRTRVTPRDRGVMTTTRRNSQGIVTSQSSEAQGYYDVISTITDRTHPHFKSRMKSGEIIVGELSLTRSKPTYTPGDFTFRDSGESISLSGDMFVGTGGGANPPDWPSRAAMLQRARDVAAISALKKLNSMVIDTGEILGTLSSTVSMLKRPCGSLFSLLTKMEKSRIRKLKKVSVYRNRPPTIDEVQDATTKTWFELNFGFRPIFQDINNAMSLYEEKLREMDTRWYVARGGSSIADVSSGDAIGTTTGEGLLSGLTATCSFESRVKTRVGTGIRYLRTSGSDAAFYARRLGLGFNNLPVSAWNLVTGSWVIDQVFGIGDWIQAAMPDPDLIILDKWLTQVTVTTESGSSDLKIKRSVDGYQDAEWQHGSGGSHSHEYTHITRALDFDLPSTPQFNPKLGSLGLLLSDAAYTYQVIRSALRSWR